MIRRVSESGGDIHVHAFSYAGQSDSQEKGLQDAARSLRQLLLALQPLDVLVHNSLRPCRHTRPQARAARNEQEH
jgi:hypothetical protein